jgi:molybdate transport system ATP-binding protein
MTLVVNGQVTRGSFAREFELVVERGEPLAVVGANGSGKSTLLHCIAGLSGLSDGSITMNGATWDQLASSSWVPPEDRNVGMVFQDVRLFPAMTVLGNVMFGLRTRGMSRDNSRIVAMQWLENVGMAKLADRRTDGLSGGEAQRVAIARALACSPEVLLLDEPLANVDAASREQLRLVLVDVLADFGGMCIVVSHDEADVAAISRHQLVL